MTPTLTPVAQAAHSVLAPSSAARRIQCPQSTTLEPLFPDLEDSSEAADGTAAHWAMAEQLMGRLVDVGVIAPNGVPLTEEMCKAADRVYDYVVKTLAPYGLKPSDGHIEQPVMIRRVHEQAWGTPDYWIRLSPALVLVLDFKFGHRIVEAFQNAQLVDYLAGIFDVAGVTEHCQVIAAIAQPRAHHKDGPIREWRTTMLELRALINISSNAAHEALGPNPRARVGSECRDCRARHACPKLQQAAYAALDEAHRVVPLELPPQAAALELLFVRKAIEQLTARQTGLEAQIEAQLKAGKTVPGWRMEHGAGRLHWSRPAAEVIAMGKALSLELAKPPEAITPLQAQEAGLDPNIVGAMSRRIPGGTKLVEDDGSLGVRLFS